MEMIYAVIALAIAAPPPADGIHVSPGEAHPGQRVHITVQDCGVGPTQHTATSDAFTRRATLFGKADTGEADPTIKNGLAPGRYRITAFCGSSTVLGHVTVARQHPAAPREGGSNGLYWVLAAAVAGGMALLVVARRRR